MVTEAILKAVLGLLAVYIIIYGFTWVLNNTIKD